MQAKDTFFEETNTPEYQAALIVSDAQNDEHQYREMMQSFSKPEMLIEAFISADKTVIATAIVEAVDNGSVDPLKALAGIKAMESLTDMLTNKDAKKNSQSDKAVLLQSLVTDAAGKYSEKKFSLYGASFTKTEVGTKYDWSQCNDPKLIELELAAKKASEELKSRQEFLKTVPPAKIMEGRKEGGLTLTDEETGETYTVYPPSKSSTSSVSVSFKK